MTDPIRIECASCGTVYSEGTQRPECPHDFTSSFTKALVQAVRDRLAKESK